MADRQRWSIFLDLDNTILDFSKAERIALTDSTSLEVYKGDSILVVFTACAPQCSSCARVYNKEWQLIRTVTPPFRSIFPLATIQDGKIVWTDNDTWEY